MSTFRILVVDDEEDLCDILQYNLEKDGYIVDIAYSAEDALKKDLTLCIYRDWETDRKSTRLNSSHRSLSRMPSSA